ncbi:MAG: amino acid ABC transporter permease [bacterium]|nr:amino acid ABC transporter permease [bacterium]
METSRSNPQDLLTVVVPKPRATVSLRGRIAGFPYWILPLLLLGVLTVSLVTTNPDYTNIWNQLRDGIGMTLAVSFIAYGLSMVFGLLIGLVRSSPPTEKSGFLKICFYNLATLYVETLRGLPILVVILVIAFALVPEMVRLLNNAGVPVRVRDISYEWRAIIALTLTYAAFLSEVFRAGIQSVGRGQVEAAKSLGMNYLQIMRLVILPQAVRRVLPPLGNDLIAMIKDSSLVAILGVQDIAQLSKITSSNTFRYLETYFIAAMIYLSMTLIGSLVVRWLERRFSET